MVSVNKKKTRKPEGELVLRKDVNKRAEKGNNEYKLKKKTILFFTEV